MKKYVLLLFLVLGCKAVENVPREQWTATRETVAKHFLNGIGPLVSLSCSHPDSNFYSSVCVGVVSGVGVFTMDCGGVNCTIKTITQIGRELPAEAP